VIAKSLARLAAVHGDKIATVYRDIDGIWLVLQRGWRAEEHNYVHCIHEMTAREVIAAFRFVHPCDCDDCTRDN